MRRVWLAFFVFAMAAMAADYSGVWTGEALADGESQPLYFTIKHSGAMVSGTAGPTSEDQKPLLNGKIVGDQLSFDVDAGEMKLHFELAPDGEGLKGKVEFSHGGDTGSGTVTLKRAAS